MASRKILVMPEGSALSHTSRTLEMAKALRQMGHNVLFAGGGKYMNLAQEAGFPVSPIKATDLGKLLAYLKKGRANLHSYQELKRLFEEDLGLFKKIKPELVLGDYRPSLGISCEAAELPLAAIVNAAWTNYSAVKAGVVEHSTISGIVRKTIGTQIGTKLADYFGLPEWIKRIVLFIDSHPYRKLRRKMGLSPCRNFWEALEGDLNLLPDIPEYAPTNGLPPNFYYVGPIIWEPEMEPPAWLNSLKPDRPTLYFTMGSTGNARLFQEAIRLFGNNGYQCLVTTGGMAKIKNVPENFFVTDFAPGSKLMEKSDLVVCHGGNGTIYQAISQGIPIIGIPSIAVQELEMQRVVSLGIGIRLSELRFKPPHLASAVEEVLGHSRYRERAQEFKKTIANYGGAQEGARLITEFLS